MDTQKFGELAREARINAGMTQPALGELLNIPQNVISRIELGKYTTITSDHRTIATHLGIPIDSEEGAKQEEDKAKTQANGVDRKPAHTADLSAPAVLARLCSDLAKMEQEQRSRVIKCLAVLYGD